MSALNEIADRLDQAMFTATATPQIEEPISLDDAYEIQRLAFANRLARGETRVGMKMGFTSRAKMVQMGVDEMIWGRLTDRMLVEESGEVSKADYVHPRAEPEIVFLLKKELAGTVTAIEAMAAVEAVAPAIEIIDSRYKNFKFSHSDVVADNSSSSGVVIGPWTSQPQDLSNLGMILSANGEAREIGSTGAILGHPIRSLVAAARLVADRGETLPAGSIVMAGGATAAFALQAGDNVLLEAENLGRVQFTVKA
ncbi:MAG: fumarylacetoacetate hydrolase family protein [Hyphomonadaceae bacterium]|nr:fumarylacetoacetate hydrolase family protein [Hyphomonadaceae bacterium]